MNQQTANMMAVSDYHRPNTYNGWDCIHCGVSHSHKAGCAPKPKPMPVQRKQKPVTDVVRADKDKITSKDRCNLCNKGFKRSDAVIRVRDLQFFSQPGTLFHRRCMEGLLEVSVDDAPKDKKKFEEYREQIADKYGIEAQDD